MWKSSDTGRNIDQWFFVCYNQQFKEEKRASKQFNFLASVSEAIPFLGWVAIAPKPAPYVAQMVESAQFYTNKILKEFRQ